MDRLVMVSADGHTVCLPEEIKPYLDSKFHNWLPDLEKENELFQRFTRIVATFKPETLDLIDPDGAIRSGGAYIGSNNVERRLAEMDREGVAAECLIPGTQLSIPPFFAPSNGQYPPQVRMAGARAFHHWVADAIEKSNGRLFGVANPGPCHDIEEAVREVGWLAEHGFRSISVPGIVADPDLPPLYSEYYEPFWRACADADLVLSVHAGHGHTQGHFLEFMGHVTAGRTQEEALGLLVSGTAGSPFELDLVPRQVMWSLILGGIFDRYPSLKLALTEVRADWVPATLRVLDERYERGDTPLARRPSEYWRSNCWAGVSSVKASEVRLRHKIGVDRMMFGRDYPHAEGTWPNTWDWLRESMRDVPVDELRMIVGENAIRCYGLDAAVLRKIADEIGPRPENILGQPVDEKLVDQFHDRAGYRRSTEEIDSDAVQELFETDLAGARSS